MLDKNSLLKRLMWMVLTYLPIFIGFVIISTFGGLKNPLAFGFASFVSGFTGVIFIVRREIPTALISIKGKRAVIEGAIITLVCWSGAIYIALCR